MQNVDRVTRNCRINFITQSNKYKLIIRKSTKMKDQIVLSDAHRSVQANCKL